MRADKPLTRSERFIRERRERWEGFAALTEQAEKSPARLGPANLRNYPRLYRLACSDLARARALKLSPDIIAYLNASLARAHAALYGRPPLSGAGLTAFFSERLPHAVVRNWQAVLASALLFFLPYLAADMTARADGAVAALFVPQEVLDQFADSYSQAVEGRGVGGASFMTAFYIRNNVSIAFLSFAGGALACLGAAYFLVYNGLFLGAIEGYVVYSGYGDNLYAFTLAHSSLELSGLVLAGAAGLGLGFAIIRAGRYGRAEALILARKRLFPLIAAFVLCIGCAAFVEGFISPSPLPLAAKAALAWGSAALLIAYFIVLPLTKKALGGAR